jgi:long-chain acyl-CoA synthetase
VAEADRPNRRHLASLVQDLRRHGSQAAVTSRRGLRRASTTYSELARLAGRCAHYLESNRIAKGDHVVIWGENCAGWLAAFFGCMLRGVVAVPIDVAGSPEFAHRVIADAGAKLVLGRTGHFSAAGLAFDDFERTFPEQPLYDPVAGLTEADILQIVFTSGTTGEPKGVVHTHLNVLASLGPIEREMRKYMKYERIFHPLGILHTLPLSHVFGQFMGIWIPVLLGAVVHFESQLLPGDLVELIRRERVSVVAAVPRLLEILARHFQTTMPGLEARLKLASGKNVWKRWWIFRDVHKALGLKFWALVSGGATLSAEVEDFWTTLGFAVIQGYGMTETAALVSLNHPFRPARGSIGRVLPGREIRLSEEGEILVRGDTVARATWEKGGLRPGESEWLATGDLGAMDQAGNLTFRGRKKDVIVTSAGLNIYPEDLETALERQAGVRAAAIVEVTGPQGPQPLAALVMEGQADPAEAVRAANRELAEYQQIRRWTVWTDPDLPRTSTGKVLRRQVAAALRASPQGSADYGQSGLAAILRRISGEDAAQLPDSARLSEDLHLDSLARTELQSAIDAQFGIDTTEVDFQRAQTLGELKQLLRASPSETPVESSAIERASYYPQWPWTGIATAMRIAFLEVIMRPLVWLLAAPRVERAFEPEADKPLLVVSNHVTEYDAPLILYALRPRMRRRVAIAMAGEMLRDFRRSRNPVDGLRYWLAVALFNVFPLPQQGNFRASFAHAGRAMDRGWNVLVFPEGRRTPDGAMHAFLGGVGILWKELGCDALPVHLIGLGELRMRRGRWFRSGRISVRIGKRVSLPPDADPKSAAALLEQHVRALDMAVANSAAGTPSTRRDSRPRQSQ